MFETEPSTPPSFLEAAKSYRPNAVDQFGVLTFYTGKYVLKGATHWLQCMRVSGDDGIRYQVRVALERPIVADPNAYRAMRFCFAAAQPVEELAELDASQWQFDDASFEMYHGSVNAQERRMSTAPTTMRDFLFYVPDGRDLLYTGAEICRMRIIAHGP